MDRLNHLFCTNRANRKNHTIKKAASVLASVLAFALAAALLIQGTDLFHDTFQGRLQAAEQTGMIIGAELYSEDFDGVADGELPEGWTLSPTLKTGAAPK